MGELTLTEYQFESLGPTLRLVVLAFLFVAALAALALIVVLAALPGQIARARSHPQAMAVTVCGVLGLPTGVLWIIAMVWAFWRYDAGGPAGEISPGLMQTLATKIDGLEQTVTSLESGMKATRS